MADDRPRKRERRPLTPPQFAKLADWGERFALALFASLVLQQLVSGFSVLSPSVLVGACVTALAYYVAYRLLTFIR